MRFLIEQITHIRIKNSESFGSENIIEVLLASGEKRSIKTIISYLSLGEKHYYVNVQQQIVYVEAVHPLYKSSYIRSCDFAGVIDNLMNLPRF
ncbi:DUF3892 domain-containing protein [uncultured Vagococcus sp.]|uniref:DUF3892 domain-containing protein n=1 Tax=uncultured Vagococcus sp. TaxID=189676 RepID=UPI0028D83D00|nr:DUF3892 domain-containing protein [uncultured Vagococcus sp.]